MIGKILAHLLGSAGEDPEAADEAFEELMEREEGGWVVVHLPGNEPPSPPEVDPLENLLIEHPSMSVYQMRRRVTGEDEEEEEDDEEEEEEEEEQGSDEDETPRPVAVRRHLSWRLAAWGIPLPCDLRLLAAQRAGTLAERKKLSRGSLHRQNQAKLRFSEKRYGHFKQPCQRLYNY